MHRSIIPFLALAGFIALACQQPRMGNQNAFVQAQLASYDADRIKDVWGLSDEDVTRPVRLWP